MSTSIEPVTFSDLQNDLVTRIRGSASSSVTTEKIKRALNIALTDIHLAPGNKFSWAERPATLITHAPYSDGTVSISTAARTTILGVGTLWNTAVTGFGFNNVRAGGQIKVGTSEEIYTVSAVTNDTTLTIDSPYTGDAITNVSYQYWENEYALASDFLRFVDLNVFSAEANIPLVGASDFRRYWGRRDISGRKPQMACQVQLGFSGSTEPQHRVVLRPYPDRVYSLKYQYVTRNLAVTSAGVAQQSMVEDSDEPIIPRGKRHSIVLHALYNLYRDDGDDARSQEVKAEYNQLMQRLIGDMPRSQDRARFVYGAKRGGYRSRRFDIGGRFDTLDD